MPGLTPRKYKSHKRYSYPRTFGTTTVLTDCDFDLNLGNFNQNEPNPITGDPALPNGCTALARADVATNEDSILYDPGFTYKKSCLIANVPVGSALPMEAAFQSGIVYGLQAVGETTDAEALTHRRGPYFEVEPVNGQDYFDSLWSAMLVGKKCISVGTPWFPELTGSSIVNDITIRPTTDWHDWEACGVTTTNGIPMMKVKWWGGEPKMFGRNAVNSLLGVSGSDALCDTDGKATPADIQTVRLNIMQVLLSYYYELLAIFNPSVGSTQSLYQKFEEDIQLIEEEITNYTKPMPEEITPPGVPQAPTSPVEAPVSLFPTKIVEWSQNIAIGEGATPESNNPGNLKYSTLTASWGATPGRAASDGGFLCQFPTLEMGQNALCNFLKLGCEDELVAFHSPEARTFQGFTEIYAGNPPLGYITGIAERMGIALDTQISTFLN